MKRFAAVASPVFFGLVCSVAGQEVGGPGWVAGPNTFGPESRSDAPAWGTASVTKLNLSSFGFKPLADGQWAYFATGWSHRLFGNAASCANVNLPSGALLEGITTYTNDTSAGADVDYKLIVFDLNASSSTTPFVFSTSGSPGIERILHAIDPPIVVDNDNNAYTLCVEHGTIGPTNQNAGATFAYRLQVSPAPLTATFADVPTDHPFFRFVEALAAAGITAGCGGGNYCPNNPVMRGQMAVFLSVALGLHFPN